MAEIKDKIVTLESLATLHAYNQSTYMPKVNNVFALTDLSESYSQYNPNDFLGFILEIINTNNETEQIMFTNKVNNNITFSVKTQAFQFDEDGNMLLYELYFYLENNQYIIEPTLTRLTLLTGTKTTSTLSYDKLYGIKIV